MRFAGDQNGARTKRPLLLPSRRVGGLRCGGRRPMVAGHARREQAGAQVDKYMNHPDGRPHRRRMDGTRYSGVITDWQSTPWGDAQLTRLPGVREWLREEAIAADQFDLEMQLLGLGRVRAARFGERLAVLQALGSQAADLVPGRVQQRLKAREWRARARL